MFQIYSLYARRDEVSLLKSSVVMSLIANIEVPLLMAAFPTLVISAMGFPGAHRENTRLIACYSKALYLLMAIDFLFLVEVFGILFLA